MIKIIYNNLFRENVPKLGRWCNKNIPYCDDNIIERKIAFAIMDNDIGLRDLKFDKEKKLINKDRKITIYEYSKDYYLF